MLSSLFGSSDVSPPNQWRQLKSVECIRPRWNPICIGTSIWIASNSNDSAKGLIEYCCTINAIKSIVPYPTTFRPMSHCICRYNESIILIDGSHSDQWSVILSFNISTKQFSDQWPVNISKLGSGCNAFVIGDTLHIMNGLSNQQNEYPSHSDRLHHVILSINPSRYNVHIYDPETGSVYWSGR